MSRLRVDDLAPYVFRTHDGGKSWQRITDRLPADAPVDAVREDPVRRGLLYAGTETGVWVSFDDGDHWQSLALDLPHSSMRDLWIHDDDLIVATHGRAFWILDDLAPLRQASAAVAAEPVHLFQPTPAVRVRRDTWTDTPLPADEPMGENPPAGAIIDYSLGQAASGPVTLEIVDPQGEVIRRYASTDQPELSAEQLAVQMIPTYWVRPFRALPTSAGMHRWVWDLRTAAPEVDERSYPISAIPHDTPRVPQGPLVLPGAYTVRLTAGGQTQTAPLTITMDPRVKTSSDGLAQQFAIEQRLAGLITEATRASRSAHSLRDQIAKLEKGAKGRTANELETLDGRLKSLLEGTKADKKQPAVTGLEAAGGRVGGLYGAIGAADVAPTAAQSEAASEAEHDLAAALGRWREVVQDVPKVSAKLQAAGMASLDPSAAPTSATPHRNEE